MGWIGCSCKGCVGIDEDGDGRQRGYTIKQSARISLSMEVAINWKTKVELQCFIIDPLKVYACGQIK